MRLLHYFSATTIVGLAGLMIGLSAASQADNFLYVGDYGSGVLHRFDASSAALAAPQGKLPNSPNNVDPFIAANYRVTEGVHGTANTLLVTTNVNGVGPRLARFRRDTGAFINYVGAKTYSGIGGIAITNDAKYVYIPDEAGNTLYRVNTFDGSIAASVGLTGVHDVVISPDGTYILAAGYAHTAGYTVGGTAYSVLKFNADLTGETGFIKLNDAATGNLTNATGMSFAADGSLFVGNNKRSTSVDSSIFHFNGNGSYINKVSDPKLDGIFGVDYGPDGNIYASGLASAYGAPTSFDCVVKYNLTYKTNNVLDIYNPSAVSAYLLGNQAVSKYLKFDTNFAPTNDPFTPEPGTIGLLSALTVSGASLGLRRRKRA